MSSKRSLGKHALPDEPLFLEGDPGWSRASGAFHPGAQWLHKERQLCVQVAEAVRLALAGCDDERLDGVMVEGVEPAPNASRLCVVVSAERGASAEVVVNALQGARGYLRRQVASSIHRKRTPQLCFRVAPPEY